MADTLSWLRERADLVTVGFEKTRNQATER